MNKKKRASISYVKNFWNKNPLFIGETSKKIGSKDFFEDHNNTIINKIFFGKRNIFRKILFPSSNKKKNKVLDLGCGIGFWLSFMENNFNYDLYGSDISLNSINIAKKRVSNKVKFNLQKDEYLDFPSNFFNHINCQGVLHHTTHPNILMSEIFRVLKKGGTGSVSVYYENFFLRNYEFFYYLIKPFTFIFQNKGRGRNFLKLPKNKFELVRLYDGKKNPIGDSFSKNNIIKMINDAGLELINYKYYFFPSRFLKIKLPNFISNILSELLPFMIVLNLKKNRLRKKF